MEWLYLAASVICFCAAVLSFIGNRMRCESNERLRAAVAAQTQMLRSLDRVVAVPKRYDQSPN